VRVQIHTQNRLKYLFYSPYTKNPSLRTWIFYPLRKQWHIINDSVAIVVSHQSVRSVYHHAKRVSITFAMMSICFRGCFFQLNPPLRRVNCRNLIINRPSTDRLLSTFTMFIAICYAICIILSELEVQYEKHRYYNTQSQNR